MDLSDGTYEVWVNIWNGTFTKEMLTHHPASVGIYCLKCLGSDGLPKSGHVDSVQQNASDLPSFAGYDLQWHACTSGCYMSYWVGGEELLD